MNKIKIILIIIIAAAAVPAGAVDVEYIIMNAVADRNGAGKIFRVGCEINCTTLFILPPDDGIADIIEPSGDWIINCDNRRFIYVVPSRRRLRTSLDLVTRKKKIYSFILEEISGKNSPRRVVKKVMIQNGISRLNRREEEKETDTAADEWAAAGIHRRYKIMDQYFHVERVEDNGIVTRVYIPRSRTRPAVFIRRGKRKAKLEPVRYHDTGDYYVVHRILKKREEIVLKTGKYESRIRRR